MKQNDGDIEASRYPFIPEQEELYVYFYNIFKLAHQLIYIGKKKPGETLSAAGKASWHARRRSQWRSIFRRHGFTKFRREWISLDGGSPMWSENWSNVSVFIKSAIREDAMDSDKQTNSRSCRNVWGQTYGMKTNKRPTIKRKMKELSWHAGDWDAAEVLTFNADREKYKRYKLTKGAFGGPFVFLANRLTISSPAGTRTLSTRDKNFYYSGGSFYYTLRPCNNR